MRCHSCSAEVPEQSRFCAGCGAALSNPDGSTLVVASSEAGSGSIHHGRFLPGTILGGRFRIVAMLGRGGMGEVFRADDLKLGQPVALKFLSSAVAEDRHRLERLYSEVRLARQVSHPNVCRVYDIGEVEGVHFLSMEYVEGEDLAVLLRRIGRVPEQKGVEISRQIAAGLAAAHQKGIVHRDLKPSNVMLDERGLVRLTDFGLAALADGLGPSSRIEGTPAYMAPEQLAGEQVTPRSDVYALGLVMYEIFTGRHAFQAVSLSDLLRQRTASAPSTPLEIAPDLSAAVNRIIMRCLEPDPQSRPASALQVAHALPGGDPLAAAIAAGETPSPDMLAAAGDGSAIRVSRAIAALAAIALALLIIGVAGRTVSLGAYVDPSSADVLAAQARQVAQRLGYARQPHKAWGFEIDRSYLEHIAQTDKSVDRWARLRKRHPAPLKFWYRESPEPLIPLFLLTLGRTTESDPPVVYDGEIALALDSAGDLDRFYAPTPQKLAPGPSRPIDWHVLDDLAGISLSNFRGSMPEWAPQAWGDVREARNGMSPDHADIPLRLEAAANQGKLIDFKVATPWLQPWRDRRENEMPTDTLAGAMAIVMFLALVTAAAVLARRNFRLGRGDRRGAFRLAFVIFLMQMVIALLTGSHSASVEEIRLVIQIIAPSLLLSAFSWLLYVAIEPYVRRCWPRALVSWNRLLLLQIRDPLVGRDILVGLALGTVSHALRSAGDAITATRWTPEPPRTFDPDVLLGARFALGQLIECASSSLMSTLVLFALLYLLRLTFRRDFIAIAAIGATVGIFGALVSEHPAINAPILGLTVVVLAIAVTKIGVVAVLAWLFAGSVIGAWPMVLDPSSWAFGGTLLAMTIVLAIGGYAFRTALGGRPVFTDAILET